jgi:hypothetical protein
MAVPAGFWPPLALADVDGDHDLDLFGPTRMLLNDGQARFTDASIRLPIQQDEVGTFAAGDLDADGDVDALAAEYGTYFGALPRRAEFLLLNDGSSFTDSRALPDAFTRPMVAASSMGRLDGDAFTDLVLDAYDGPLQLLPGDGTGRFGSPVNLPRPAGSVHALRIARVDPDGANDLVLAADNGVKVLYGPALGLTATPIATETRGIAHGDLDGDGDVDLVTSEIAPANNRLLLQGPPRSFTLASAASFPKLPGAPSAVDVLDADSDGDLDVVFAQATVKLYLNRGLATFVDVSATHVPGGAATSVAAGDVDGDGATDLVAGSSTDQRLLLNLGDGHFVPRPDLLDSALPSQLGHLLVDSDRDGDLDLLHGTWGPLYTNDGRGSFGQPRSVGFVSQPVAADVDGDGDLDVLAVGNGQEDYAGGRILRNHGLQLTWLSLPSVGEPLVLEISGPPLEPFVLAAAPARGTTATPYGTLWLDPGSARIVGRGHLDVSGRKRCTFAIPPTPALIGATRYWQALVGRPPRLTNLEATTFTDL